MSASAKDEEASAPARADASAGADARDADARDAVAGGADARDVGGGSSQAHVALIDRVAARYGSGPLEEEIRAAREAFDALRGRIFDDDVIFPEHMAFFLEWYVIERPLDAEGISPLELALREDRLSSAERPLARALSHSHRALFEVLQHRPEGLRLYDFVGDCFWWVSLDRSIVGIARGEIFEARLIPWEGRVRMGPQVFYHPRAAHGAIRRIIEARAAADRLDSKIAFDLAEMRLRFTRFRNIAIDHIYRDR